MSRDTVRDLCRSDYVASKFLEPHGVSSIETTSLRRLWDVLKEVEMSYLTSGDMFRQSCAISQAAKCLKEAIHHFRQQRVAQILDRQVYAQVQEVTDYLYGYLQILDGGFHDDQIVYGVRKLTRPTKPRTHEEVQEASDAIYLWLRQPSCPFRSYLQIMSGGGVVYAAQCEEKALRAYVECRNHSPVSFGKATKKRLFHERSADNSAGTRDDKGLVL